MNAITFLPVIAAHSFARYLVHYIAARSIFDALFGRSGGGTVQLGVVAIAVLGAGLFVMGRTRRYWRRARRRRERARRAARSEAILEAARRDYAGRSRLP